MRSNPFKNRVKEKGKINIITLGCSKNLVDSEVLLGQLKGNGLDAVHEEEASDAKTVVVNTCGFIDEAKEESIQTILTYAEKREAGEIDKLIVTGCLSERYKTDLIQEIPEVDAFFGTQDLPHLVQELGADYKSELVGERPVAEGSHYAYLKIAEGCNRPCSFCAIPLMRGKHRSRDIESLVEEAKFLVQKGVKELMLIAQDLTYYGIDLYGRRKLNELLQSLGEVEGLEWIRLHYAYPSGFPVEILPTIRTQENICNYLDIPLQHIADPVLKHMRRGINKKRTEALIDTIRAEIPNITLRTTLLVGHPGESQQDHEELLEFVSRRKFDRLGIFTYSHEEGTYAGNSFEDQISEETKETRKEELMELQQEISLELNRKKVGRVYKTLVDSQSDGYFIGRTEADSPEVDNEVLIYAKNLTIGDFYSVEITDAMEYDLIGKIAK
ncbi:MAG: 30S ribosomal protein S12 methylthiotransferase RimO [Bacteroidota bacterium]